MRVGIVFAGMGTALTVWAIASAQDGPGSRSGPMPASVPGVRNYYDDLFADQASDPSGKAVVRQAGGTDADSMPIFQAGYERTDGVTPRGEIRQVTAQSPASPGPAMSPPAQPAATQPVKRRVDPPVAQRTGAPTAPRGQTMPFPSSRTAAAPTIPTLPPTGDLTNEDGAAHRLAMAQSDSPAVVEATWERAGEISVGRESRCELVVKNTGAGAAGAITVEAFFPPTVRLTNAVPPPNADGDRLTWSISSLAAGAEQRIAVTLVPSEGGDLALSAIVRSTATATTTLAVREPMLHAVVSGPEQVTIGETVAQSVIVSNPGTGTTEEVLVEITLPSGLEHGKGPTVTMPIGALAPNQSHVIPLTLFATQGGPQSIRVRTVAGSMLRHEATGSVFVAAPTLRVAATGPSLRFVGRDAAYAINVTNEGAAAANNVRVTHAVPKGFEFVAAETGGRFEPSTREIVWFVGRVESGQSVELVAKLTAATLGEHRHVVTVTGDGGARMETDVATVVDGAASLVVEVLDLGDPVELGT